ncbi:hypothetical protein RJ640_011703 [Escallonia rubra]|uniref:Retrovirus-related Pol polyprotein from transposon TNT 1-94-like beta-barrel domain-containing protein n=1 Tax=Escallonia rubra TaxID=112253 RepID=A0AA88QNV5_9ASTE|nr:hypothetical protein RJ640_011703 [Escallonia rubra]
MNTNEWAILDGKALATVRLSLTPQVAFNIYREKTIAVVMQALEKLYASNKVFLMKRLFNMRMSKNGSVVDHLNAFNSVTNQLEYVGINFDDEIRALLFLCSLSNSWNNLVTTMSNSFFSGTLTLNDIVSSVMNDEMQRKTIGDGISFCTALSMESRDSGASIHYTPHMDCFYDYVHDDYGHVTVGNGYLCNIVGKGKVEIKLPNGGTVFLKDVRHIPELQKNLVSVSELDREDYFMACGEKQWKVIKGLMVVARGERYILFQVPRIENPEVFDETTEIGTGNQQQVPETPNLRRSGRVNKAPDRLCLTLNYILYTDFGELECYQEVLQYESRLQWKQAMNDEMASLEQTKLGIGIVAIEDLHLEQLDIKTTFLHRELEEEIYMHQPESFEVKGSSMRMINELKKKLASTFSIKDLGEAKQLLSMRIIDDRK